MRNRIAEWLTARFGNSARVRADGRIQFVLTERGVRDMQRWIMAQKAVISQLDPVRKMVKTEGWAIFERSIRDEILSLWTEALSDLTSADAAVREGAVWKAQFGHLLNKRVLERVNGKALDVTMIEQSIADFANYVTDYEDLTGGNSNG